MKKLIIVCILVIISFFGYSNNDSISNSNHNSILHGKVIDLKTNETLVGVQVSIKNTNYKTYTDIDGNFYFNNLPNEKYEIIFSLISYNSSLYEPNDNDFKKRIEVKLIPLL